MRQRFAAIWLAAVAGFAVASGGDISCAAARKVDIPTVDLESIVIRPGDLPAGFSAAQVRDKPPAMFNQVPDPDRAIYQQLEHRGGTGGGITILGLRAFEWVETGA